MKEKENMAKNQNKEQCTKFQRRLRTQDRRSGDKIWLPLDEIAYIYNPDGGNKPTLFTKWLKQLAENVYVHYLDNNHIKSIQFKEYDRNVYLKLIKQEKNGQDTKDYDVKVVINGTEYPALTPIGKGKKKEKMVVKRIEDIAIDHIIPIDKTLRDLGENQLDMLGKVSMICKKYPSKKEIKSRREELMKMKKSGAINTCKLLKELVLIGNSSPLRLMLSKYNSQKSNEETFLKVFVKEDEKNKTYFGILKEKIDNYYNSEQKYYLCQKLSNELSGGDDREYVVESNYLENATEKTLEECIDYI